MVPIRLRARQVSPRKNSRRSHLGSYKPRFDVLEDRTVPAVTSFGINAQHTGLSAISSQPLEVVHWQTLVDDNPTTEASHYGAPLITDQNTVIYPHRTTAGTPPNFHFVARNGTTGAVIWDVTTDWTPAPHNWYPPLQAALTPINNRVYFPGAGGTIYYRDADAPTGPVTQLAFYGLSTYHASQSTFDSTVFVDTAITADSQGNIFFGIRTTGSNPANIVSGIARISVTGVGSFVTAQAIANNDPNISFVEKNASPALSNDESVLYVAVRSSSTTSYGRLAGLNTTTLATQYLSDVLKDPRNGGANNAVLTSDSTSSPMVAPDGRVFFGIFGNPNNGSRGFMLQFSADLATEYTPGGFGWDNTPTIVPASMVPQYTGTSTYLLFSKYNNYFMGGDAADGTNMIAILDPNDTEADFHPSSNGLLIMKRVLYKVGVTPDVNYPPPAVDEWCINTATVDPATKSVMVNSEDGKSYRWYLPTNTLAESIALTNGISQPYTMTVIGMDGTFYGIQGGTMFAVGQTPKISIDDPMVTEGTGGTTNMIFTVSLNAPRTQTITVHYATANGTATAGSDYTATSGTLTFNPGEMTKTISVSINPDSTSEPNETLFMNLSAATNAVIQDIQGTGTIIDDDSAPSLSINDVSMNEGDSGTTSFTFTVSLSAASAQTVTLNYATADGTALAPGDYQSASGGVTFMPGQLSRPVTVVVNGDTTFESDETFFVNLSGANNATIADSQGQGTIVNDDPQPSVSINDVSANEGNSGTTAFMFTVSLSNPSSQTVTVNYATADGTAQAPGDYQSASGTLTFNPGQNSQPITVLVNGDTTFETNETFFVNLSTPNNATIADSQGQGTILNDDTPPPPPQVQSVDINAGAAQRSRVTQVKVNFDSIVNLPANPADAFQLARLSDNALVTLSGAVTNFAGQTHVLLTFIGGAIESGAGFTAPFSLQDGRYTMTVLSNQVSNSGGQLDGDGNGTGGDDFVFASASAPNPPSNIFRFFGDLDGDGDVDATNFLSFRDVFLGIAPYDPALDFDGGGSVDAADFLQFRNRFLQGTI